MATFDVSAPDGQKYSVNAPDGASESDAIAYVQKNFYGDKPAVQPSSWTDKIRNAAEGVLEPALSIATGSLASPIANAIGVGKELLTGDFGKGTAETTASGIQNALTYQPRNPVARDNLAAIGKLFDESKLAGVPMMGNELPMLAQAAAQQRPFLGAIPAMAANSTEATMAKSAASALNPVSVSPEAQQLAQKFQSMGGKIPLHQLSNNRLVRMAGEGLDNLPLSGSTQGPNKVAFNQELLRQIGGDPAAQLVTPQSFAPAMDRTGAAIGDIYSKTDVPLNESFLSDLGDIKHAQRLQVPDVRNVVNAYIDDIVGMAGQDGTIPGEAMRTQDTALGARIRALPPGDLRSQLSDLQESMRDALNTNLSPADAANLQQFRKQYAIGKLIEPLVAKSGFAGVSPQALMGREAATAAGKNRMAMGAAGDMGDLANIGQQFIKQQPSSGTAERGLIVGGLMDLGKAAVGVTAGNLYNRLGPKISSMLLGDGTDAATAVAPRLQIMDGPIPQASPLPGPQYGRGLLSMADEQAPQKGGLLDPGIDFPLRQDVLQAPAVQAATQKFTAEAERLQGIIDNKYVIDPRAKAKAASDLQTLQQNFAAGMQQLGIQSPQDATGLRRPIYQTGGLLQLMDK